MHGYGGKRYSNRKVKCKFFLLVVYIYPIGVPEQTIIPFSTLKVVPGSVWPHPSGRGVQLLPSRNPQPVRSLPLNSVVNPFSGIVKPIKLSASGLGSFFPAGTPP